MIRDMKGNVKDIVSIETVLVSVYDKTGLDELIPALVEYNPMLTILSTGGTLKTLREIYNSRILNRMQDIVDIDDVSDYTGSPEMEGGLVKTLHPKIHAGILGERGNDEHQQFLDNCDGLFIDMVVVNLYPFSKVIGDPTATFEKARGNIDIGGPAMLRGAAKNFPFVTAVCDPADYASIIDGIRKNEGTTFDQRLRLAKKAFHTTAMYDRAIADHFAGQVDWNMNNVKKEYLG
jgi:phosphoribosylaminoimidazolecarboxamide formyltransferase / IMP cyclohydrolase